MHLVLIFRDTGFFKLSITWFCLLKTMVMLYDFTLLKRYLILIFQKELSKTIVKHIKLQGILKFVGCFIGMFFFFGYMTVTVKGNVLLNINQVDSSLSYEVHTLETSGPRPSTDCQTTHRTHYKSDWQRTLDTSFLFCAASN